ncbi:hypothetical protein [Acidipropionibacterium jensenii]|uniref:hypothetical protein n=1 Tax=Acidipropionibacterium jensenii TaxID=1749 RepID=UPI00214D07A6|nr:hypothetical protein [Acidipropionibacterium jensenii]
MVSRPLGGEDVFRGRGTVEPSRRLLILLGLTAWYRQIESAVSDLSHSAGMRVNAATGSKVRAHWVCGHWRNQWYVSAQEHHMIWIDGFVRGDGDLGIITGPKVYLA